MNKEQFFSKLQASLNKLPENEKNDILQDFEEHFAIGFEEGKTEEEITSSLGDPQQIGKELVATHHVEKVETHTTSGNIFRALWAVIGLGFFNLVFVLSPFLILSTLLLAGWIVSSAFVASPILLLINIITFPETFDLYDIFFSMGLVGVGLFIGIGMYYTTLSLKNGLIRYLKYNIRVVKGGLKHA